ncbi:hypothetical protein DFH27DRAFT_583271 [Peziza echinospora]|nr:hypothetical protein DFH27DRAFT_583271 [Peziza echinospora]
MLYCFFALSPAIVIWKVAAAIVWHILSWAESFSFLTLLNYALLQFCRPSLFCSLPILSPMAQAKPWTPEPAFDFSAFQTRKLSRNRDVGCRLASVHKATFDQVWIMTRTRSTGKYGIATNR